MVVIFPTEMAFRFSYLKKFLPTSLVRLVLAFLGPKESTQFRNYFLIVK